MALWGEAQLEGVLWAGLIKLGCELSHSKQSSEGLACAILRGGRRHTLV